MSQNDSYSLKLNLSSRWVSTDSSSSYSSDSPTVIRMGSIAVCRGWYQNQQVAGGTDAKNRCAVSFFEKRQVLDKVSSGSDVFKPFFKRWRWNINFSKLLYFWQNILNKFIISLHNFRMIENFKSNFTINLVCHIPPFNLFFFVCPNLFSELHSLKVHA